MSVFDKLGFSGSTPKSLTPMSSLLLACITMITADGHVDDDELAIVRRLDGDNNTSDWENAKKVWKASSIEECIRVSAAGLSGGQRVAAMANLIEIAMADGILEEHEKALLEAFVDAFEIDDDSLNSIINVIAVKNNRSIFLT